MGYAEIPLHLRPGLQQVVSSKGMRIARNLQLPSCRRKLLKSCRKESHESTRPNFYDVTQRALWQTTKKTPMLHGVLLCYTLLLMLRFSVSFVPKSENILCERRTIYRIGPTQQHGVFKTLLSKLDMIPLWLDPTKRFSLCTEFIKFTTVVRSYAHKMHTTSFFSKVWSKNLALT